MTTPEFPMLEGQPSDRPTGWSVYMILTDRNALYTGIAINVERRFLEHLATYNGVPNAKGAKFFRSQKPLTVVYRKSFSTRSEASREEMRIKSWSRTRKIRELDLDNFNLR